jgi:hypothetical protein
MSKPIVTSLNSDEAWMKSLCIFVEHPPKWCATNPFEREVSQRVALQIHAVVVV